MYSETNYNNTAELLQTIRDKALLVGWTVELDITGDFSATQKLYLKNPENDCVVFFEYTYNSSSKYYQQHIYVNVASDYDNAQDYLNQPNQVIQSSSYRFSVYEFLTSKVFTKITNNKIFFLTRQHSCYLPLYLGKYLAYKSPIQEPYPFIINGGNGSLSSNIQINPYTASVGLEQFSALNQGFPIGRFSGTVTDGALMPWTNDQGRYDGLNFVIECYENNNNYTMFDVEIFSDDYNNSQINGSLGALEGMYAISRDGMSPEYTFSNDGDDYIVLKSDGDTQLYFALKK